MGVFSSFLSAFADGYRKEIEKQKNGKDENGMEARIYRARTEGLKIAEYCGEDHKTAKVSSGKTGKIYLVSDAACECEDFKKHGAPCKHILFLAMENGTFRRYEKPVPRRTGRKLKNSEGEFVPAYWEYYSGGPTGIGYLNLYPYEVSGRTYGISAKTGRETNRKKVVFVNARSREDAIKAAEEKNVMPPYEYVNPVDTPPTESQYAFLHGAGIPAPYFITAGDIGALLTRFQDEDDNFCPRPFIDLASRRRVSVSMFESPKAVLAAIWHCTPEDEKPALFCYAVMCQELGQFLGLGPVPEDDAVFRGFVPEASRRRYILSLKRVGYEKLNTRSYAYMDAVEYLKRARPELLT